MPLKVLLRENIAKLGKRGDIVSVKPGYARNYLLPRGYAWVASKENQRRLDAEKRQYELRQTAIREELEELAQKLQGTELTLMVQANEEGHLYGAIHGRQIAEAFIQGGVKIGEDSIILESPVKEVGPHNFKIRLHPDIKDIDARLFVVPQGEQG
ncbi:MAG: 50S ribosomal protein L9 [Planctomycetota bacterium]